MSFYNFFEKPNITSINFSQIPNFSLEANVDTSSFDYSTFSFKNFNSTFDFNSSIFNNQGSWNPWSISNSISQILNQNSLQIFENNKYLSPTLTSTFTDTFTPTYMDTFTPTTFNYSTTNTSTTSSNKSNKPKFTGTLKDYDARRGEKLANIAFKNSENSWTGNCATYVKNAIQEAGLGSYVQGDAHETDKILAQNSNFKRISTAGVDVNDLPAGCILVYEKGAQGYSEEYGHVEITSGDGRGISDGITQNLRKPSAIFIPVSA